MAVNDELLDSLTRHEVYLRRYSTATLRKVMALLKRSDARIFERLLEDDLTALSRTRQEKLLTDLRRVMESAYIDATGALQVDLEALATYEGEFQTDLFKRVLPVKFDTVTPTAEQLIAAVNSRPFQGKLLKEVYPELAASAFRRVRDTIRAGIVEGRTTDQIVRELRGRAAQGYKDGILAHNRLDVESVVRTALTHTANSARQATYKANDDLVKGWQFTAVLDGRTTMVCMGLDQRVFDVGKGPMPPRHYNCRSASVPIMKSWRELGFGIDELPKSTRASMNGQVPADQSYNDWLGKQDTEFQNSVLGARRGQLFRAGMTVEKFTDASGEELTLDQLRLKEASIFEKAGL